MTRPDLRPVVTAPSNGAAAVCLPESSWEPVDLAAVLAGTHEEVEPTILARTDGVCLLYRERVHGLHAEPESGKGWLSLRAAVEVLASGGRVALVDFEDTPTSIALRLVALGAAPEIIAERLRYVQPTEPATDVELAALAAWRPALVIFDGLTEAFAVDGLGIADNDEIAQWQKRYPRPLARAGAAVLLVDHVTKDRESRGRYAIGGQHKLAGVDVAYSLHVLAPLGRGRTGRLKLKVEKDRPGFVRGVQDAGHTAALVEVASLDGDRVSVTVRPPDQEPGEAWRPTVLMERLSRAIEVEPGMTARNLRAVPGKTEGKDQALRTLIDEGYVEVVRDGSAHRHFPVKPYRDEGSGT